MLTLCTTISHGHDFWLEAKPYYSGPAKSIDISTHIGTGFIGDSMPNIPSWYSDFSLYQPTFKSAIEGELGRDPAGYFSPEKTGTYLVGFQSEFSYIEIDPVTFLKYLNEEGLDNAIESRQRDNLSDTEGRENYIRHAKLLVQSGDDFSVDNSQLVIGYDLEIIPLSNPYRKRLNDNLSLRIDYLGQPIENILLIAFSKDHPNQQQAIRSDSNGEVTIQLNQPGPWLLKAVKILPAKDDKADWQSHWASLTFELR